MNIGETIEQILTIAAVYTASAIAIGFWIKLVYIGFSILN